MRRNSVFTTHTPVPAGHDAFDSGQIAQCTGPIWEELGTTKEEVLALGHHPDQGDGFHMTVLALRLAGRVNGVSERHGEVSREIWRELWPGRTGEFPDRLNAARKLVASRTLTDVTAWNNSSLLKGELVENLIQRLATLGSNDGLPLRRDPARRSHATDG